MDKLNHPLARGASYLLIYLTAFQPLHPAFAAGITAANGNTQVVIKPGNVPVVNIATPNGAGISHNSYKDFNVAAPGAVLNNATAAGQSQLAGQLNANGNLKGKAAELIINEVTGGRRSELQGKLEVFGNKANVMIANPNGISCDGCGFINAPGVTLTTGKPQFDKQGALEALEVKKGSVIIGSKGLDGYSADYVDILSRATEVNGQINANNLSLTQGANRVSFKDGTVTPIAGEGAKPQLAVDTKALGGMYANKIRLVANEDGVGVNLRDIITNQRDITLSAKGKMTLGGTFRSKTDLNVSANELLVAPWSTVQADQDVTLASPALTNAWQVTASRDIRVFSDTVRNVGADAKIHANNNLWIQKDAQGNKANLVENRSATIKTNSGDLVIRTENLENTVDTLTPSVTVVTPQQGVISQNELGWHMTYSGGMGQGVAHVNAIFDQGEPNAWFGNVDFNTLSVLPVSRQVYTVSASKSPVINSGHNLFINATSLHNLIGDIHSANDMVLTGNNFSNESRMTGILGHYYLYPRPPMADNLRPNPAPNNSGGTGIYHIRETIKFKRSGEAMAWEQGETLNSTVTAGGNLVADFHDTINIDTPLLYSPDQVQEVSVLPRGDSLTAHNIVLRANNIIATDNIRSATDITLQADNQVRLGQAQLLAARETSVVAGQDISFWLSRLQGTQVNLVSRNGDIRGSSAAPARYYRPDGSAALANITANDLTMNAGKNIDINATELHVGWNIAGLAGKSLLFLNNDHLLTPSSLVAPGSQEYRQRYFNQVFSGTDKAEVRETIALTAGEDIDLPGTYLRAGLDMTLNAGKSVQLGIRPQSPAYNGYLAASRTPERRASVNGIRSLQIAAGMDIAAPGAYLYSDGNLTAYAGRALWLGAQDYSYLDAPNDNNKDERSLTSFVRAGNRLTLAANDALSVTGSALWSGADMTLTSGGNMRFDAVQNRRYQVSGNEYTESLTQQGAELNAGGALTAIAGGSVLFQAARLTAKRALDVAAKGGYLYAQAVEESNRYEDKKKKCSSWNFCITKKEVTQTRHDVTHKVTEFTAGDDINLLSRDDSTYEASKIAAGQNARLTSTQGKINFRAVKNTTFEKTVTSSKGIYITQSNRGYEDNKWVLPSIYTGGSLTVEAANGISADVKVKNGQTLRNAVAALGNAPGTTWLKDLDTRKDVQWNTVRDAYSSWDYKSQHLNPAVAAVIAIAAAAVTAGTGLAAAAGQSAVTATGVAGATASSAVYGSAYAGMTSLASQVAVALVDNQGNLSKTLQALGNSQTVKATATAMAIGGALAGFDQVLDANVPADKARLPVLIKDEDWSKIAQRVAGQSVISSSLNTTINGGSFKDNLTNALLANIGSQVQAEGANLIGDNGDVLGAAGKSVSHAVVAGIAAEIGRGDGKGAAAGALAAELAGVVMQSTLFEPANLNEKERQLYRLQEALNGNEVKEQTARVIGALTGALTTHTPEGAYSAADSAQSVYRYNMTEHMLMQYALDNQKDILAADKGDVAAAKRVVARREAAAIVATVGGGGLVLTAGGMTLVGAAPELVLAARLAIAGCKTNPALCLNQAGIYAADIVAPEAIIGTGAVTTGSTLILGKTEDSVRKLSRQLVNASDELYKTKTFNTQPVADFIKGETAAGANLSTKTADYLRDMQKANTNQLVKVFDPKQNDSKLNVFGQQFEQVLGEGGSNKQGNSKVFSTEKLSQQVIFDYAQSLTGGKPLTELPTAPGRFYAVLDNGGILNLRNVSRSSDETKARWTIEIKGNEQFEALQGKVKKRIEIKFR
ncbi:DUF637 domain-containing protein [Serratia marcescens]|uniref:two-partner secretion domain-containing protein n=2 Tax=Serratia marcescens TaxID=615 RepID=UPI00237FE49A|nr:DUF637 domain-containing protein [Serratia marcescens]